MDIYDKDKKIAELAEELNRAKEREKDYTNTRKAMLYMLEDINTSAAGLQRAKQEWETTFDSIEDPIFMHDTNMNIVRANSAYSRLARLPFGEIIGRPYYKVFPKMEVPFEDCLKVIEDIDHAKITETEVHANERIFRIRFYPIRDPQNKQLNSVHIFEDVTEMRITQNRLEEEMKITTSLLSVAEAVSGARGIERLMEHVVRVAAEILGCEVCLSYLKEKDREGLTPCQAHGLSSPELPVFRTEQLDEKAWFIKEAIEKKQPTAVTLTGKEDPFAWLGPVSMIFVIPLEGRAGSSGIIISLCRTCGKDMKCTVPNINIAKGISRQVSTALDEARLFRESTDRAVELSHKIETITIMHEIDKNILSTLKSEEILDTVIRLLVKIIPCDRATIVVVDRERGGFIYQAGFGTDLPKGVFVPFSNTSGTMVIETGQAQYVADLLKEKNPLPIEKTLMQEGFVTHLRMPISIKNDVVAILTVGAKKRGAFTQDTIATLDSLASQVGIALENSRLVSNLQALFINTIKALSNAIDAKSPWTKGHSERVTNYAVAIGSAMGLSLKTLDDLRIAGLLHDIGKIGTYDEILNKPDKLTDKEYEIMKNHPARGAEVLEPIKELRHIVPWIKYHHETYDGKGYPDGLKGTEIPLEARILSVADTFDSMTAERPYRPTPGFENAIMELKKFSNIQFDPEVVDVFIKLRKNEP
ncbi:MAG: HD domain-containing protein [Deltaproteobacteria bacterium]|nr:HD domain-containing protein [Deltaproteobacteria bacterium]